MFSPQIIIQKFVLQPIYFWQGDAGKGWEVDEKEGGEDGWEDDGDWGELEVGHWHYFGLAVGRLLTFFWFSWR